MTFLECLDSEIFINTKTIRPTGIVNYLEDTFKQYKTIIENISDKNLAKELNTQKSLIDTFCSTIVSSLKIHLNGNIEASYQEFKKAMDILKPFLLLKEKGKVADIIGLHKPLL